MTPSRLAAFCAAFLAAFPGCTQTGGSTQATRTKPAVGTNEAAPAGTGLDDEERKALLEKLGGLSYVEWDSGTDLRLKGVTRYDKARTDPGYNIYTDGGTNVFLLDLEGRKVHTWHVDERREKCPYAELLSDNTLAVVCNNRSLTRLDWNSKVVWEVSLRVHHDVAERPDGTLLVPYHKRETYRGRRVFFDGIAFISPEGKIVKKWYTYDHRAELRPFHLPSPLDTPPQPGVPEPHKPDYYHLNSVEVLAPTDLGARDPRFRAGNILICLRNMNLVAVLDQDDLSVVWSWGTRVLEGPHMPTMLPDGHILLFDNGVQRQYTKVLEVDPLTEKVVWEYQGNPPSSFYSELRGSNQRLPNGDTLICEADRGHVIEVTPVGEIVWEFWNPDILGVSRRRIYRFMRLPASRVEPLLAGEGVPSPASSPIPGGHPS